MSTGLQRLYCVDGDTCRLVFAHQVSDTQKLLELLRHWIVLHGHEDGVEDNADGDAEVQKGVHDDGVETLFDRTPTGTTVPLEEDVGEDIPTRRTWPLVILEV